MAWTSQGSEADERIPAYDQTMDRSSPSIDYWTPEQLAHARQWARAWQEAGPALERLRREELRHQDQYRVLNMLCGPADYRVPPRAPKPTSGLIEQQRWFMKAAS